MVLGRIVTNKRRATLGRKPKPEVCRANHRFRAGYRSLSGRQLTPTRFLPLHNLFRSSTRSGCHLPLGALRVDPERRLVAPSPGGSNRWLDLAFPAAPRRAVMVERNDE
jgi:hypothetical protein